MTFHYRYRKQIIIGSIIFLLSAIIITSTCITLFNKKPKKKEDNIIALEKKTKKVSKEKIEENDIEDYKVDIKGEVNAPGIYTLTSDSRVIDVIEQAGGLTENADTSVINLSKKITDEMVIIIYSREQVNDFKNTKEIEKLEQEKCNKPDENSLVNGACITNNNKENKEKAENNTSAMISINTATKEELMTLPGIGESKANDIITYREQNGPFTNIEDITKVSGIGENTFAQIKENITV